MVTAAMKLKDACSLEEKIMTKLDSILKSRDVTLLTKVHLVTAMVFPVVMYGCESWTIKKPEHQRIDAFELWCWRRLSRVPWTARRSKQSILKEVSPEYSLEELLLKLKLHTLATWCEELTHWKRPWCWERLKAGMIGCHHQLNGQEFEQTLGDGEGQGSQACCSLCGSQRVWHDWASEQLHSYDNMHTRIST